MTGARPSIYVPTPILEDLRRAAEKAGETFSEYLVAAAVARMSGEKTTELTQAEWRRVCRQVETEMFGKRRRKK